MKACPDEDGFTLIEALVALALGVAVVAVVLSTLRIASGGAARSVAVAAEVESFARAGALLAGDARHALALRDARGAAIFAGQPQSLTFVALPRSGAGPVMLRFVLVPGGDGSDLIRAEAAVLATGDPGPFGAGLAIWHGPGAWEFRYLDAKGQWRRDWSGPQMPQAFGLAARNAPQTVELVASFPALIEPDCATGPGPGCSLLAGVFP